MEKIEKGQWVFELSWCEISTRSEIFSGDLTDIVLRLDKILQNLKLRKGDGAANDFAEGFVAFCQRFIACPVSLIEYRNIHEEYWTFPITTSVSFREGVITSGGVIVYLTKNGTFKTKRVHNELKSAMNQLQMYVSGVITANEIKNLGID